jgi:hypothetical protein
VEVMEKKFRCYVAGALNSDACGYIQNMHRMVKVAREIRKLGVSVYVPCNDFLEGLVDGNFTYADYFENSQPWLEVSDFIFVCPGYEKSKGTAGEIDRAQEFNLPIFYTIDGLTYALNHQGI